MFMQSRGNMFTMHQALDDNLSECVLLQGLGRHF